MPGHRELTLPPVVQRLLHTLQQAGYEAYVVGGCGRDSLRGRVPNDWDICTSALPNQLEQLFGGYPQLLNGKRHGTVAVVLEGHSWEITTFRQDGAYTDGRHPDSVRFVPDVCADLARRDFTVNAMAWSPDAGLIDPFGGRRDLAAGLLRCVGDPGARFAEDALRVLRAARFAAPGELARPPAPAAAARRCRDRVARIAPERLYTELDKLLAGPAAGRVLAEHGPLLAGALPAHNQPDRHSRQQPKNNVPSCDRLHMGTPFLFLLACLCDSGPPEMTHSSIRQFSFATLQ